MIEDIKAKTEELRQRVAAIRIAEGKPPEPPEDFVPIPLSIILAEKLKPFLRIAAQFASVVSSGAFVRVDTSKLINYRETSLLLCESLGSNCKSIAIGVKDIFKHMDKINAAIDEGSDSEIDPRELTWRLHFDLKLMQEDHWDDCHDCLNDTRSYTRALLEMKAEVERLKSDPDAYQAELDAAWRHYRDIEHLI